MRIKNLYFRCFVLALFLSLASFTLALPASADGVASAAYEVTDLTIVNDSLSINIVHIKTGLTSSINCTPAPEDNSYWARLPDNTLFYLDPAFGIDALHTDSYFAESDTEGRLLNDGRGVEYLTGATVFFGSMGEARSFTLWLIPDEEELEPELPPVVPDPPAPENPDTGDPTPGSGGDNEGSDDPGMAINVKGLGGGGCNSGADGLLGMAFVTILAATFIDGEKKKK
jgi:hypothetical protein